LRAYRQKSPCHIPQFAEKPINKNGKILCFSLAFQKDLQIKRVQTEYLPTLVNHKPLAKFGGNFFNVELMGSQPKP
jgi:hypothetical protein